MNILTDDELRYAFVQILRMETARTKQTRIGASDLCDRCDRCLAMKMRGIKRTSPQAERPWFGREWGTAVHGLMESRINEITAWERDETLTPQEREQMRLLVQAAYGLPEGTRSERRVKICDIPGYGEVFGTIDVDMPHQIVDFKGSTRMKSALLHDYLEGVRGGTDMRWEKQRDTKAYQGGYKLKLDSKTTASLSYKAFQDEMAKMVYKMDGYFGQQSLYMHARRLEGQPVAKGSIAWLNRDGNGWADDPASEAWVAARHHDVWILSFDYNHDYALALIDRGAAVYAKLEAGAEFAEFEQSEWCYACSFEKEQLEIPDIDVPAPVGA